MVHPFEIVAHPVRRRILDVLALGDHSAGTLGEVVFELWEQRYGTAEDRAPSPPIPQERRMRRFGEAERRRRREALAAWGVDAETDV